MISVRRVAARVCLPEAVGDDELRGGDGDSACLQVWRRGEGLAGAVALAGSAVVRTRGGVVGFEVVLFVRGAALPVLGEDPFALALGPEVALVGADADAVLGPAG